MYFNTILVKCQEKNRRGIRKPPTITT